MIGKLLFTGGLGLSLVLSLSGCGSDSAHTHGHEHGSHGQAHSHDDHGQDHGHSHAHEHHTGSPDEGALSHYIAIQETLAADSMDGIGERAAKLAERLSDSETAAAARMIAQTDDIEAARRHFETVSVALLADLKEHGSSEGAFYEAHCPMAFNNRGASWIQADTTVNNPYYGSRMLRCGEIRETFAVANGHSHAHHHDHPAAPGIEDLPEGARTIEIKGDDFRFEPADITVAPGEIFALKLENVGQVVHMWEIEGRPETHVHAEVGQTAVGVIVAPEEPGEYRTVCTEPGHAEAGMVGRLTVREKNGEQTGFDGTHSGHNH